MQRLCLILISSVMVSGCVQTAAVYNLPRFSPDGQEVFAVKLEGDEVQRYGTEPIPAFARSFPADLLVALDLEDGSERRGLSWREIKWYRQATQGQWRFNPQMSEEEIEYERRIERRLADIVRNMSDRWAAQEIKEAKHFPTQGDNWTYRVFDISPDSRYVVVEDHGSIILYDVDDGWSQPLAEYQPGRHDNGDGWLERNGGLLLVGLFVVGIVAAIIVGAAQSGRHHGGGYYAGHH